MRRVLLTVTVVALAGCGDPATEDARGYTKAPLEEPGLLVRGEPVSPLAGVDTSVTSGLAAEAPDAEPATSEGAPGPDGSTGPEASGEAAGEPGGESGSDVEGAAEAGGSGLAEGVSQAQFEAGRELFSGTAGCMACHGTDGTGSMLGPDLTDGEWIHVEEPTVAALVDVIEAGVPDPQEYPGPMPAMGGGNLSEDQVRALAAYVASLGGG